MGDSGRSYGGVPGAFPYAFRASESRLFRSYVVIGGFVAIVATFFFAITVMIALADTFRSASGTFTFSRSFVILVALVVIAPVLAPVLFVARRHRHGGSDPAYDRVLGLSGYVFLASVYLTLLVSAPPKYRDEPPDFLAPVIDPLYALPQIVGLVPLVLGGLAIYLVHRRYR